MSLDFLKVSTKSVKKNTVEVYPTFLVKKSKDLMIKGGDFYAIWDEEKSLWSTDEYRAINLIDAEIERVYQDIVTNNTDDDITINAMYLWDSDSDMITKWHKFVQKSTRDNYTPLNETIIFSNQETTRETYASVKLPYPLQTVITRRGTS